MEAALTHHWFRSWGWIYRPISPAGWILTLLLVAACAWVFVAVDRKSHSVSDTLIGVFPYATLFVIITYWVASHTAGPGNRL